MVTESLIKQVQLLELLGYPLPRGQTRFVVKGLILKIISICAQDHNLEGLTRQQATENEWETKKKWVK